MTAKIKDLLAGAAAPDRWAFIATIKAGLGDLWPASVIVVGIVATIVWTAGLLWLLVWLLRTLLTIA